MSKDDAATRYIEIVTKLAPEWEDADPAAPPPACNDDGGGGGGGGVEAKSMGPVQSTLYVAQEEVDAKDKTVSDYVQEGNLVAVEQALLDETEAGDRRGLVNLKDESVRDLQMHPVPTSAAALLTPAASLGPESHITLRTGMQGLTLLHWACDGGHAAICKCLVDAGADVNVTVSAGACPLRLTPTRIVYVCTSPLAHSSIVMGGACRMET